MIKNDGNIPDNSHRTPIFLPWIPNFYKFSCIDVPTLNNKISLQGWSQPIATSNNLLTSLSISPPWTRARIYDLYYWVKRNVNYFWFLSNYLNKNLSAWLWLVNNMLNWSLCFLCQKTFSNILKPNTGEKWVKNGMRKNIVLCSQYKTHAVIYLWINNYYCANILW